MPCRYDPTPAEVEAGQKANKKRLTDPLKQEVAKSNRKVSAAQKEINELTDANNALSVRVDYLQDLIWRIDQNSEVTGEDGDDDYDFDVADEVSAVLLEQANHRQADIDRIVREAANALDYVTLRKALEADVSKPLEPQLGFNPDNY